MPGVPLCSRLHESGRNRPLRLHVAFCRAGSTRHQLDYSSKCNKNEPAPRDTVVVVDLGTQEMEELTVYGTRTTMTIPAGAQGNDRPIETVRELWFTKELNIYVQIKSSDPRNGETTLRTTNINRSEPDHPCFECLPTTSSCGNRRAGGRPRLQAVLNFRVAHPCLFKSAGFLALDSPSPLAGNADFCLSVSRLILVCACCGAGTKPHRLKSVPLGPFFARGVFRREEKPAPFTKTVKSAAPENPTHSQSPAHPACCHSERSEESLRGFACGKDRDREILRFAQNDTQLANGKAFARP